MIFTLFLVSANFVVTMGSSDFPQCLAGSVPRLADDNAGDALTPFYGIGAWFLKMVHSNKDLNVDHVTKIIDYFRDGGTVSFGGGLGATKPLILDEIFFIILLIFGLSFAILFPLIGLIFCCCRMSDRCGGQKYQKSAPQTPCVVMTTTLIVCVSIFLAFSILYGFNNKRLYNELSAVPIESINQIDHVADFISNTSDVFACSMKNAYARQFDPLNETLQKIDKRFIDLIMNVSGLDAMRELQGAMQNYTNQSDALKQEIDFLCNESRKLNESIFEFEKNFSRSNFSDYERIDTTRIQNELSIFCFLQTNLSVFFFSTKMIKESTDNLSKVIDPAIKEIQKQAREAQSKIDQSIGNAGMDKTFTDCLSQLQKYADKFSNEIRDFARKMNDTVQPIENFSSDHVWCQYVTLIFILPIALITLCLLVGLCCGLSTYNKEKAPFERASLSDCGGCCLVSAAGLIFCSATILMMITMAAFAVGYLGETAVCQSIFSDSHVALNVYNFSWNWTEEEIDIGRLVDECKNDQTIFEVLHLEKKIDLDGMTRKAQDALSETIGAIDFLDSFNAREFDFTGNNEKLEFLRTVLEGSEKTINGFMGFLQSPNYTITELINVTKYLEPKSDPESKFLLDHAKNLSTQATEFSKMIDPTNETALITLNSSDQIRSIIDFIFTQDYSADKINASILNEALEIQKFVNDTVNEFLDTVNETLTRSGSCRPMYDIYQNIGVLVCQNLLYPLHGFWMTLGVCLIFFVPAVVCAMKLAKYFRKMDETFYNDAMSEQTRRSTSTKLEMTSRRAW